MPLYAYMEIPGIVGASKSRKPDVAGVPAEGHIPVTAFTHEIRADLDPATHRPSANVTHGLLVITKNVDMSSVALRQKYKDNAELAPVLKFWQQPRSGPETNYFKIGMLKAKIAYIRLVMPSNIHERDRKEYEEIGFTYGSISYKAYEAAGGDTLDKGYGASNADYLLDAKFGPTGKSWLGVQADKGLDALADKAKALAAQQALIELQYAQYKLDNPPRLIACGMFGDVVA
jgi:type VI secretion system Hcp family effector